MSLTAPVWLAVAGLVAAGVVIAHLITITQPRRDVLPTVRFIPQTAPLAVRRARRPTDLLLLATRLLAVALLGLALAGAHVSVAAPARVIVVDHSTAASDSNDARRQAATASDDGKRRRTATANSDSVVIAFGDSVGPQRLSGALVAAHRAIAGRDDREQSELVIMSPVARAQIDSATASLLALWPGPVRVVRTRAAHTPTATHVQVIATGDDPVLAATLSSSAGSARLFRSRRPTPADSAWARDSGGVLVVWPADLTDLARREPADTQQGVAADGNVVIGTFARTHTPRDGRAVVRWLDGAPAATEVALGAGCVREVAIPVDAAGDLALRESFRGLVRTLTSPCGGPRDLAPADLASILPSLDRSPAAASVAPAPGQLPVWLALGALALLLAEQLLRRRAA